MLFEKFILENMACAISRIHKVNAEAAFKGFVPIKAKIQRKSAEFHGEILCEAVSEAVSVSSL